MGHLVWLKAVLLCAAAAAVTSQQAGGTAAVSLSFTGSSSSGDCSTSALGTTSCSISGAVNASVAAPSGPVIFTATLPSTSVQLTKVTAGSNAALITFQGPMTVVTDLAFPKFTSPGNYLVPNPSSNPAFTSTGSPINGGLGNLTFAYNDVTLQVPCLTLQNYLTLLCRNDLDDSVLVNRWGIFFRTLNATAATARNVNVTCGAPLPSSYPLNCSSTNVYTGQEFMQALSDATGWATGTSCFIHVMRNISLAGLTPYDMTTIPSVTGFFNISNRLVIQGIPGPDALRPEIDLAGGPSLLQTYLNSAFTIFKDVTLANLPPGPPIQMAHAALTALGWHAYFLRRALGAKGQKLVIQNSTFLLPPDEMYVWTMYTDPTPAEVARYADIQGSSFRIGLTNVIYAYNLIGPVVRNTSLTFDYLYGQPSTWQYMGVTFLNSAAYPPAAGKATVTEGGFLRLAGWSPDMINTADYQVTFSISDSNVRLGPSSSIGIQYQYLALAGDTTFMSTSMVTSPPVTYLPITLTGNLWAPQYRLLDLMSLPPCLTLANASTFTLSSMVLWNAAPLPNSVTCGAAALSQGVNCTRGSKAWLASGLLSFDLSSQLPGASPPDLESALGGLTSVLWMFRFSRSSLTSLQLVNVTIMVPDLEMQAIRELATTNTTRVNLPATTLRLMSNQLAKQTFKPASYPPGGLYFPTFSWFGIRGKDVYIGPYTNTRPDGTPWTPGSFLTQATFPQRVPSNLTSIVVADGPVLLPTPPPPASGNQSPGASGVGGTTPSPTPGQQGGSDGGTVGSPGGSSGAPASSGDVGQPASIAGVAVGAAVGSLCVALGVLLYIRYRQQRKEHYKLPSHLPRKASERTSGSTGTALFGWFASKSSRVSKDGSTASITMGSSRNFTSHSASHAGDGSSAPGSDVLRTTETGRSVADSGDSTASHNTSAQPSGRLEVQSSGTASSSTMSLHSSRDMVIGAPGSGQGAGSVAPRVQRKQPGGGASGSETSQHREDETEEEDSQGGAPRATGGITPAGRAALARVGTVQQDPLQTSAQEGQQLAASGVLVVGSASREGTGNTKEGTDGAAGGTGGTGGTAVPAAGAGEVAPEEAPEGQQAWGPRLPTRGLQPIQLEESGSGNKAGTSAAQRQQAPLDPREELQRTLLRVQAEAGDHMVVELIRELGKGSYGVVFQGIWRGLEVAVKRLVFSSLETPTPGARDARRRRAALHEAALNASLAHPNVVATYSYSIQALGQSPQGIIDWQLLLIQEFCDVGSLYDALQGRRLWNPMTQAPDMPLVLNMCMDITAGLSYIHARDIIHGDLKPDNILLRNSPQGLVAKVADFGMAAKLPVNRTHLSGVMHGTPLYIAPEVLQTNRCSKASDVYSFGVVCWELMHGRSAWAQLLKVAKRSPEVRHVQYLPGLFAFNEIPGWGPAIEPYLRPQSAGDPLPQPPPGAQLSLLMFARLALRCLSLDPTQRPTCAAIAAELAVIAHQVEVECFGQQEAGAAQPVMPKQ